MIIYQVCVRVTNFTYCYFLIGLNCFSSFYAKFLGLRSTAVLFIIGFCRSSYLVRLFLAFIAVLFSCYLLLCNLHL